jgi:antitoxin component of MazEF toxin-antitoxin module
MPIATFEGEIIDGKICFEKDIRLPKSAKVYVIVSEIEKKPIRKRVDLAELVSRMPADYAPNEEDFGKPQGKEVW